VCSGIDVQAQETQLWVVWLGWQLQSKASTEL
jgi:hypothetical protein